MKVKRGDNFIKLPYFSSVVGAFVTLSDDDVPYYMMQIEKSIFCRLSEKAVFGMPSFFWIDGDRMRLYPIPDKEYEIRINYYPPMETA